MAFFRLMVLLSYAIPALLGSAGMHAWAGERACGCHLAVSSGAVCISDAIAGAGQPGGVDRGTGKANAAGSGCCHAHRNQQGSAERKQSPLAVSKLEAALNAEPIRPAVAGEPWESESGPRNSDETEPCLLCEFSLQGQSVSVPVQVNPLSVGLTEVIVWRETSSAVTGLRLSASRAPPRG